MGNYSYHGRSGPFVEVPEGSLDGFFAAMDNAHNSPAGIMAYGDSLTQGQANSSYALGSFDWRVESYPYIFLSQLLSRHPSIPQLGEFFSMGESEGWTSTYRTPQYNGEPWTDVAGNGVYDYHGWYVQPTWPSIAAWSGVGSELVKFTAPPGTMRLDHYYHALFGTPPYTFKYNVNGVPGDSGDVTVTINSTQDLPIRETIWRGQPSRPVVRYGSQSQANQMRLLGMTAYYQRDQDAGILFGRMAFSGKTLGELVGARGFPADRPGNYFQDSPGIGFPLGPALAIMGFGVNDNNRTNDMAMRPEEYQAGLVRCVDAGRRRDPNASYVFVAMFYPNDYGDQTAFANRQTWFHYVEMMRETARTKDCVFVNWSDYVGSLGADKGYMAGNDGHITREGHRALGVMLADAVSP